MPDITIPPGLYPFRHLESDLITDALPSTLGGVAVILVANGEQIPLDQTQAAAVAYQIYKRNRLDQGGCQNCAFHNKSDPAQCQEIPCRMRAAARDSGVEISRFVHSAPERVNSADNTLTWLRVSLAWISGAFLATNLTPAHERALPLYALGVLSAILVMGARKALILLIRGGK